MLDDTDRRPVHGRSAPHPEWLPTQEDASGVARRLPSTTLSRPPAISAGSLVPGNGHADFPPSSIRFSGVVTYLPPCRRGELVIPLIDIFDGTVDVPRKGWSGPAGRRQQTRAAAGPGRSALGGAEPPSIGANGTWKPGHADLYRFSPSSPTGSCFVDDPGVHERIVAPAVKDRS